MARKDINDLEIYRIGMKIGQLSYNLVLTWNTLNKNTIGYQLIRSADSIAANISEGYGRYHFKEQRQYCYIARGSLYETRTWLEKAQKRIIKENDSIVEIQNQINILHIKLNSYIKYIEQNMNSR